MQHDRLRLRHRIAGLSEFRLQGRSALLSRLRSGSEFIHTAIEFFNRAVLRLRLILIRLGILRLLIGVFGRLLLDLFGVCIVCSICDRLLWHLRFRLLGHFAGVGNLLVRGRDIYP